MISTQPYRPVRFGVGPSPEVFKQLQKQINDVRKAVQGNLPHITNIAYHQHRQLNFFISGQDKLDEVKAALVKLPGFTADGDKVKYNNEEVRFTWDLDAYRKELNNGPQV